jgi:hypothetical protein
MGGEVVVRALVDGGLLVGFTGRRRLWTAQATGGAVVVGDCCLWPTVVLRWGCVRDDSGGGGEVAGMAAAAIALQRDASYSG